MSDFSILVGGPAGSGVKQAGIFVGQLFQKLGYSVFIYQDYPSLVKGGHNFMIVRASEKKIRAHQDKIDVIVAFDQNTIDQHQDKMKKNTIVLKDVDKQGVAPMFGNTVIFGALAAVFNLDFKFVENVLEDFGKKVRENKAAAQIGYDQQTKTHLQAPVLKQQKEKLVSGNEALGLGAVKAGLQSFYSYPMTPATGILHFLAAHKDDFKIKVVHPENEIAVAMMAVGSAYAGHRTMVASSGGGFALMVESVSLAGQAELPIVYVLVQRMGPATGVPTYTAQADLPLALGAGHGEFLKIVVAPGTVEQAHSLTARVMNLAWKFQSPAIILSDKQLGESFFSADLDKIKVKIKQPKFWDGKGKYQRYAFQKDGISALAFPGNKKAVVKSGSYESDEDGVSTEDAAMVKKMVEKRNAKLVALNKELARQETYAVFGDVKSKKVLITWGSTVGPVIEVAEKLGLKVVQPLFLNPFLAEKLRADLAGAEKIIDVELNSTAQLADLLKQHGIVVDEKILKYDSRPFTVDELEVEIKKYV